MDLRVRLAVLLAPIPIGTVLADEEGAVCTIVRVVCGGSQWDNHQWDVTLKGKGALTHANKFGGKLLCEDVEGFHNGSNWIERRTGPSLKNEQGPELTYESGVRTRALAARLPAAIARYLAECERERVANEAAAVNL